MAKKNYITPRGWRAIIDELSQLVLVERPRVVREVSTAAAEGDRSENAAYIYGKRRLREIDGRTGFLQRRLAIIEVVDGRKQSRARVFFGAVVDLEDEAGEPLRYQIVGVDEVDAKAGKLSWESPVGQALLGKRVGDTVKVRWHAGERELTVDHIDYLADPPPGEQGAAQAATLMARASALASDPTTEPSREEGKAKQERAPKRARPAASLARSRPTRRR